MLGREIFSQPADQCLRLCRIAFHHGDDRGDIDLRVIFVPAIVIGHHRDAGITKLGFARELGFRHVGHTNHIATPRAVKLALGSR